MVMIMITTMRARTGIPTHTEQLRHFRFQNLTGQHAVDQAYLVISACVDRYPSLDDEEAIQIEALVREGRTFDLYFASHLDAAREVVESHTARFGLVGGLVWLVGGRVFGNALYRWRLDSARRALRARPGP